MVGRWFDTAEDHFGSGVQCATFSGNGSENVRSFRAPYVAFVFSAFPANLRL
jgi:hypothetical protein